MIVGPDTISTGPGAVSKADITDEMEKTILFTETTAEIPWTAPMDIPFESLAKGIEPSSEKSIRVGTAHPKGYVRVMYADWHQSSLPPDFSPDHLKALATINGGENTDDY